MNAVAPGLEFDPKWHTYRLNGRRLQSVTSLVSRLKPHFDAPAVAERVAQRDGRETDDVLAEWEAKRNTALDAGHVFHDAVKTVLELDAAPDVKLPEFRAWLDWYRSIPDGTLRAEVIERQIAHAGLGIAGTIDAVMFSTKTNDRHVMDWKTGAKFRTRNRWENLLPPFDDLPNTELALYSIQTSIYRLMLDDVGEMTGPAWIIHCRDTATPYRALDLRTRLRDWIPTQTQP